MTDWIDYRASVSRAMKRADADDETLEICAHCGCEIDIDPQPHQPDCKGIGKPRASREPVLAGGLPNPVTAKPPVVVGASPRDRGLDALERMDAGEPQIPDDDEPTVDEASLEPQKPARTDPPVTNTPRGNWTKGLIVEAIVRWNDEHGEPPRSADWTKRIDGYPTQSTVINHFGKWTTAIAAAGFTPRRRGGQPSVHRDVEPIGDPLLNTDRIREARSVSEVLTFDQVIAAGHTMEAIASHLCPLERPDRQAVWAFVQPLIEKALA